MMKLEERLWKLYELVIKRLEEHRKRCKNCSGVYGMVIRCTECNEVLVDEEEIDEILRR